jgi:3-hydroxyisobutyrate dehydrogenase-like beta-hydroxyacid dehydrogenase
MLKLIMIGALGTMLGPASQHLRNKKVVHVLRVLDRGTPGIQRDQRRQAWQQYGASLVTTLEALIAPQDFDGVVLCAGKNGDDHFLLQQLVPNLKPNTFILHLSTVSCAFVTATQQFCANHQIDYVNYPLTGGALGAAQASLLILASGAPALYQKVVGFLQCLGQPRYLGEAVDIGASTKLIGHVLVFNGLFAISSAVTLQARCQNKAYFFEDQVPLFDFLNQGAGGTRQWPVALKNGVQDQDWQTGFLLKHAAIDMLYLLQLMIEKNQFISTFSALFELAYSFAYLLQQGCENDATQIIAQYWLDPEKSAGLQQFLTQHADPRLSPQEKLAHCVALFPEQLRKNVLLDVVYTNS